MKQNPVTRQNHLSYEPSDPKPQPLSTNWGSVPPGLRGAVGSRDRRYAKNEIPEERGLQWSAFAWRGERVSGQFLLWSSTTLRQLRLKVNDLPFPAKAQFVRFVRADQLLVADILDDAPELELAAQTTRPVWLTVDVPQNTKPGSYTGTLTATAAGGQKREFALTITVVARVLPPAKNWSFYLDLWQNPYAIARFHQVPLWSEAHLALLRPHLARLADAGQKVLTTTILHAPWGGQTFDPYESMIEWIQGPDGKLRFDYTVFDRYVAFGRACGIGPWIHGYSMIPWTNQLRVWDEATAEYRFLDLQPDSPSYEKLWAPFLNDFQRHLERRGWLKHFRIAMDERPLPLMRAAVRVLNQYAPRIPLALAGDANPAFKDFVDDWCQAIGENDPKVVAERNRRGVPTTFYVCCNPARPNTFTASPPAEANWIGLHAAQMGYSGFLRWAYDSWTEDPLYDTKHTTWDAGDCFLVYPGNRSSIRFERLREGIQDYEKIRILRQTRAASPELEAALARCNYARAQSGEFVASDVNAVKNMITTLSLAG